MYAGVCGGFYDDLAKDRARRGVGTSWTGVTFSRARRVMLQAADFLGEWQLERVITDHAGDMSGTLAGTVTFSAVDEGGLVYREEGTLHLAQGAQFTAQRQYHWRWETEEVIVTFADGAAFHSFAPSGVGAGTAHLCGADLYNVTYDFADWPAWQAVWQVKGPRKDYTSVSRYTRG